jgi:hypothetical protein
MQKQKNLGIGYIKITLLQLIEAILSRKPTFLELHEWQNVPFQQHFPSPMQRLLSCAAVLPSLLQKADFIKRIPSQDCFAATREVVLALTEVLEALQQWEQSYKSSSRGPLYWPKPIRDADPCDANTFRPPFWFPNATTATALIHFWAFQVICLTQIEQLEVLYEIPRGCTGLDNCPTIQILEGPIDFSVKICQSMGYFLEDQMKIYGPAAAIFPFQIAYETLFLYLRQCTEQTKMCEHIIFRFSQKGFDVKPPALKVRSTI